MSLKVVLPFSLVVFGGASAATTGVYFHNQGSDKGTNRDGTGNDKTLPALVKEETKRNSTVGNIDEKQTGNTRGVTSGTVTERTQAQPEQKLPEGQGDNGSQNSNLQQSTGPGPSPSPENLDSSGIQKSESTDRVTEESNLKTEKEGEQQDNSDRSEGNDKGVGNSSYGKDVPSTEEGGASGSKPDSSSPSTEKGTREISGGEENSHLQSQGTGFSPDAPEQSKTAETKGTTGESNQNNKNTGSTAETGNGTKEPASGTTDNAHKDSGSSGGSLPSEESK